MSSWALWHLCLSSVWCSPCSHQSSSFPDMIPPWQTSASLSARDGSRYCFSLVSTWMFLVCSKSMYSEGSFAWDSVPLGFYTVLCIFSSCHLCTPVCQANEADLASFSEADVENLSSPQLIEFLALLLHEVGWSSCCSPDWSHDPCWWDWGVCSFCFDLVSSRSPYLSVMWRECRRSTTWTPSKTLKYDSGTLAPIVWEHTLLCRLCILWVRFSIRI